MNYIIFRDTEEECERVAKQLRAVLPAQNVDVSRYDMRATPPLYSVGVDMFAKDLESGQTMPICGLVALQGYGHIYDHGQGYGKEPIRTKGLERCEASARKYLEKHPKLTTG